MILVPSIRKYYEFYSLYSFLIYSVGIVLLIVIAGSVINIFLNKILSMILERSFVKDTCVWLDSKLGL